MPPFLDQFAPWGLTWGQSLAILALTVAGFALWTALRFFLRLGQLLFQLGCAVILLFICGVVSYLIYNNLFNQTPPF
jgi:hypothetical protein